MVLYFWFEYLVFVSIFGFYEHGRNNIWFLVAFSEKRFDYLIIYGCYLIIYNIWLWKSNQWPFLTPNQPTLLTEKSAAKHPLWQHTKQPFMTVKSPTNHFESIPNSHLWQKISNQTPTLTANQIALFWQKNHQPIHSDMTVIRKENRLLAFMEMILI